MVNNPTRRRILETLVREPNYPLQLSKEIGVSQQAIMKNLDLLEKNGMVISRQVSSNMGPMRTMYSPTTEFTLVIDMRSCMFTANVLESGEEEKTHEIPDTNTLDEIRASISEMDREIEALERERLSIVNKRQQLMSAAMARLDQEQYSNAHRALMYNLLNRPEIPIEEIVGNMIPDVKEIEKKLKDIENAMSL